MKTKEIWKDVVGYEGTYQVSSLGRVKRLPMAGGWKAWLSKMQKMHPRSEISLPPQAREELILSQSIDTNGYYKLNLKKDGIKKTYSVHQLVAKAFIPNPENHYSVDHIDGVKLNNNLSNLRWASREIQQWNRRANKSSKYGARRNKYKGVYYSPTYKSTPNLDRPSGRKIAEDLKKGIDNRYTVTREKAWNVQMMVGGKLKGFGWYHTEKEAVEVYNKKIKELRGDFAVLNKYED
jgi:hypothetical protein